MEQHLGNTQADRLAPCPNSKINSLLSVTHLPAGSQWLLNLLAIAVCSTICFGENQGKGYLFYKERGFYTDSKASVVEVVTYEEEDISKISRGKTKSGQVLQITAEQDPVFLPDPNGTASLKEVGRRITPPAGVAPVFIPVDPQEVARQIQELLVKYPQHQALLEKLLAVCNSKSGDSTKQPEYNVVLVDGTEYQHAKISNITNEDFTVASGSAIRRIKYHLVELDLSNLPIEVIKAANNAKPSKGLSSVTVGGSGTFGKFTYIDEGNSVCITGYPKDETGNADIPADINGKRVTSIGERAFDGCINVTNITIPCSVINIKTFAFNGCWKLTSVRIPSSVTSIGESAFMNCDGLINMMIPSSVTSIGKWAFMCCRHLPSVSIPASVTSIGFNAFADCPALTSIHVDSGNSRYSSVDGVLFSKSQTSIIKYPEGKEGASYTIPSGVTSIAEFAFCHSENLTSITIPASVRSIGDSVFSYCSNLKSARFMGSAPSMGEHVFDDVSTDFTLQNTPYAASPYIVKSETDPTQNIPDNPPSASPESGACKLGSADEMLQKSIANLQDDLNAISSWLKVKAEMEKILSQGGLSSSTFSNMSLEEAERKTRRIEEDYKSKSEKAQPSIDKVFELIKLFPGYSSSWDGPSDRKKTVDNMAAIYVAINNNNGVFTFDDFKGLLDGFAALRESYSRN